MAYLGAHLNTNKLLNPLSLTMVAVNEEGGLVNIDEPNLSGSLRVSR